RKVALQRIAEGQESLANIDDDSFPFRKEDLRYRRRVPTERPSSNAAIVCIMDTSGSMDSMKKYLARSFFFMLYQFVRTKYENVEIAFIAHHTQGKEVTEEEFFHKGESGGTMISSGYKKALEVIHDRYHPEMWNVYAFHCSDGDNLSFDNPIAVQAAEELCDLCNLFGYGEIKPASSYYPGSTMLDVFDEIARDNFKALSMKSKEDIWPVFREFMSSEKSIETH
ncbi:MAG TPA: sporulation protein YhbH, partial [Gammaproteobacteria bacterium]|nr:sporulation protein YhbH [Gammaproteobacteria bacterium]